MLSSQVPIPYAPAFSPPTHTTQFRACKHNFESAGKPTKQIWVFHGTPKKSVVPLIMTGGFEIGGIGVGVGIANGYVYGHGVYAATGPDTPMGYAGNSGQVILARAFPGTIGGQERSDSWIPRDDWYVFSTKEQLLPVYVVHYGDDDDDDDDDDARW